jgi:hypothetical protein
MEFLGDMGHVESYFSPFGNYVSVGARKVHSLRQTYYRLRNDFGCARWYSYVTRLKCYINSVHLMILLILTQGRCTVWAECTTGLQIVLDALDGITS